MSPPTFDGDNVRANSNNYYHHKQQQEEEQEEQEQSVYQPGVFSRELRRYDSAESFEEYFDSAFDEDGDHDVAWGSRPSTALPAITATVMRRRGDDDVEDIVANKIRQRGRNSKTNDDGAEMLPPRDANGMIVAGRTAIEHRPYTAYDETKYQRKVESKRAREASKTMRVLREKQFVETITE